MATNTRSMKVACDHIEHQMHQVASQLSVVNKDLEDQRTQHQQLFDKHREYRQNNHISDGLQDVSIVRERQFYLKHLELLVARQKSVVSQVTVRLEALREHYMQLKNKLSALHSVVARQADVARMAQSSREILEGEELIMRKQYQEEH